MKKTEDEIFVDSLYDLIKRAASQNKTKFTHFLNEKEVFVASKIAKGENICLWGGYETAARKMLGVFADYDEVNGEKFPFTCLRFEYRKQDSISHRDILGSLMALQIKRNAVGDIIVDEGVSFVFAENTACKLILSELNKVGRVGVKISISENPDIKSETKFEDISGTVSSCRADNIVALVTHLSRNGAQNLITSKGIMLNYEEVHDTAKNLAEGDIFSIQGYGKFVIDSFGRNTKSGRMHILIKKYS